MKSSSRSKRTMSTTAAALQPLEAPSHRFMPIFVVWPTSWNVSMTTMKVESKWRQDSRVFMKDWLWRISATIRFRLSLLPLLKVQRRHKHKFFLTLTSAKDFATSCTNTRLRYLATGTWTLPFLISSSLVRTRHSFVVSSQLLLLRATLTNYVIAISPSIELRCWWSRLEVSLRDFKGKSFWLPFDIDLQSRINCILEKKVVLIPDTVNNSLYIHSSGVVSLCLLGNLDELQSSSDFPEHQRPRPRSKYSKTEYLYQIRFLTNNGD